jgi:hypothetical protein
MSNSLTSPNSSFLLAAGQIDGGLPIEVADEKLKEVVSAVLRTGKPGTVALTIKVSRNGELGLTDTAQVTAKAPAVAFGQSFFFQDREGGLTRDVPGAVSASLLQPQGAK